MIRSSAQALRKAAATLCAAVVALTVIPTPAQARVFVGVGVGVPFFGYGLGYPYPYYYPPPVYYAPPPVYYAPPQAYTPAPPVAAARGQSCNAGSYVCPMERPTAAGSACYCPAGGNQRVWGRAS